MRALKGKPMLEHDRPVPDAGYTAAPESQLAVMNSAWLICPALISWPRIIPAMLPTCAAVPPPLSPSPFSAVRP